MLLSRRFIEPFRAPWAQTLAMRPPWSRYAFPVIVGILLILVVNAAADLRFSDALRTYRELSLKEAGSAGRTVEAAFHQIYHNLRTISLLPTVREIDRHGNNLSPDARASINQIYNNLASDITVSEVYIVPGDFEPDRIDPVTGKTEAPILEFDELVTAYPHSGGKAVGARGRDGVDEEIEIYEYRQLSETVRTLKNRFPTIAKDREMAAPLLSGGEIITCDNTEFKKTKLDADRKGIIFSIPFYSLNGSFKGTVSAIIRTNALRALLPERDFALINLDTGFVVIPSGDGQHAKSLAWVHSVKPDPGLIFSSVLPIDVHRSFNDWKMWAGHADNAFLTRPEVKTIAAFRYVGYCATVLVLMLGIGLANWSITGERRRAELDQWRDLSNAAVEGLAIIDADTVIASSRSFGEMIGSDGVQPEQLKVSKLIADPAVVRQLRSGVDERIETSLLSNAGLIPVEVQAWAISYEGRPCRVLAIRDLRERRSAERKISEQLEEVSKLASHNEQLSRHLQLANSAAATLNEKLFRRVGADIHDGPVQLIAYALLSVGKLADAVAKSTPPRESDVSRLQVALQDTLQELREISSGLALPELETLSIEECIRKAIFDHEERTNSRVAAEMSSLSGQVPHALKLCAFRFVQEALNNAFRHGQGVDQRVTASSGSELEITVSDRGPGFSRSEVGNDRLGLSGLRARIAAIGGTLEIASKPHELTSLNARFNLRQFMAADPD